MKAFRPPHISFALPHLHGGGLLSAGLAAMLLTSMCTGCSSKARPLALAFGGLTFSPDAVGLHELISKLPTMNADEQKSQLRGFADSAAPVACKRKADYVLGRALLRSGSKGDLQESISRFTEAAQYQALAERCEWHISEAAESLGDEKAVRHALQALTNTGKTKDVRLSALYGLGQSYMRTNETGLAREQFNQVTQLDPDSQFALGSSYYLAELDIANDIASKGGSNGAHGEHPGDKLMSNKDVAMLPPSGAQMIPAAAMNTFRRYLTLSPGGRFARDIVNQIQKMPGYQPTSQDHNLFANVYFSQSDWADALDEWKKAGNTTDWFKQATAQTNLGRASDAKASLTNGIKNHPTDQAVSSAATMLARQTNRDGAIAIWKQVLQRSPQFADVALYNLAIRASSSAAALPFYGQLLSRYPNSAYAPESAWWLAWADVQAGKSAPALSKLQAAASAYSQAKAGPRFQYWIGKIYERLGQKAQAKTAYNKTVSLFPKSYYGHRAQARLAALASGRDRGWSTIPQRKVFWTKDTADDWSFPEPPEQLAKQEGPTVEVLTELQQWDEAIEELPRKTGLLRAFYLAKMNLPLDAINAAYPELNGAPQNDEGWQIAYPLLYARTIGSEAPAKKVDPFLVQALIREESRYNVDAVSGSHALGLMQLMPATAYGVAKRLGVKLSNTQDIHRPENNIKLGVDYLSYVLNRFKGNALYAVASYNGGPNAVQSWAAKWPGDTDVFVENIPFRETRDYVRKVFGSYWNYEAIYGQSRPRAQG